jgi:tetratricopeptide (TPR) repeat protein
VSADRLLTAAQELAARDGLRAAVLAYMEAVDALVAEKRIAQAQSVMIDLLKAHEKKKGLFGRTDKNPLGSERVTVGLKFAAIAQAGAPTEDALDQLGYLAQDFPDELTIRRANADALRQSGYAADAIDEYRYCAGTTPDDADVNQYIADLYVGIGRPDDAAGYLVRALRLYGKRGEFAKLAEHAESLIELSPASLGDLIDLLSPAPGASLVGHLNLLDELSHRVLHAGILDPAQRAKAREQLQALYERLVLADRGNEGAARGLEVLKSDEAVVDRRRPDAGRAPAPQVSPTRAPQAAPVEPRRQEPAPVRAPEPHPMPEPAPVISSPIAEKALEPVAAAAIEAPAEIEAVKMQSEPAPTLPPRRLPAASNALAAFTRRKAKELFDAGDFAGAVMSYERLLRSGSDADSLEGALDCYIALGRAQDASRIAVELIDVKAEDGDLDGALATIDRVSALSGDADFSDRRRDLLAALGRPEVVGR